MQTTEAVLVYTKEELLEKTGLPRSTFYYRLKKLQRVPDQFGYYTDSDLEILKQLDLFLKNCPGGGIQLFLDIYNRSN